MVTTSKEIRETNGSQLVSQIFFRCLIFEFFFFTNADVVRIMRHLTKISETNGGKIKKQDVPLT